MIVTLKKASALQRNALESASKINPAVTVSASALVEGDATEIVEQARAAGAAKYEAALDQVLSLVNVAYQIRRDLGVMNAKTVRGVCINDMLAERADAEAQEKRLTTLLAQAEMVSDQTADEAVGYINQQRLQAAAGTISHYHLMASKTDVTVVSEDKIATMKATLVKLRHRKTELTDLIAEQNAKLTITLPDDVVDVLRKADILA